MINLENVLKTNEQTELLLDEFCIHKNCIIFENVCIQISNVSSLRLFNVKEHFPQWTIVAGILGLVMFKTPLMIVGLAILIFSAYNIYQYVTKPQVYLLQFFTNNGFTYNIPSQNKVFLDDVITVFTNIINGDSAREIRFDMKNCVITDTVSNSIINNESTIGENVSNTVD